MQNTADAVWRIGFDLQPTAIVILSCTHHIVFANKACRRNFENLDHLVGKHVSSLPLTWQDGTDETFLSLLTQPVNDTQLQSSNEQVGDGVAFLHLAIEVCRTSDSTLLEGLLLVSDFGTGCEVFRMLSFENLRDSSGIRTSTHSLQTAEDPKADNRSSRSAGVSLSGYGDNTTTQRSNLELRFSQLCEAIYQNEQRSGFLLAADQTFCYPNYTASKNVQPVEIDDIEMFMSSFNLWDSNFERKLEVPEYPAMQLNKHRTRYRGRCGMVEDGKKMVLETDSIPLFDPLSGEYVGGVVWVSTLGEHSEVVAKELNSSLSDFGNICDRLPHLLWTVDASGMADYFSESWYNFTGLNKEQSLGLAFTQAIDPTDMKGIWDAFEIASSTRIEVNREARYRRKDGQWRWMNVRAKPLYDLDGKILKWYGSSTEVDNLVEERLSAEKKKDQMMQMLSLTDIGLFEVDTMGCLKVLEGRMGWLADQVAPLPLTDLANDPDRGMVPLRKHLQEVINGRNHSVIFEVEIRSRWYKFRLISQGKSAREAGLPLKVLGCSVDVTEQRGRAALEAENARLVHEATLEVEKSHLKTAFLAHVSHEIRTPIAGIIGTADMLIDTVSDAEQREGLENINVSAHNLLVIVNDILDLSKVEAGQMQFESVAFDLHALIAQLLKLFLPTAQSKFLDLRYIGDTTQSLEMIGDPGRVRQILTNLVSNAIKFTSKGYVELSIKVENKSLRVEVSDTGEGIDPETMKLLFKPFVQGDASTARRHGGTGLGLTISRNLASMMGGSIVLKSTPGKGTRAILVLPRESGTTEVLVSSRRESGASLVPLDLPPLHQVPSRGVIHTVPGVSISPVSSDTYPPLVLVVEDNAINQKVAVNLVKKLGYATHAVWNGQEALTFLEKTNNDHGDNTRTDARPRDSSAPSLILMDCQMPLLDGYQATRILRTEPRYDRFKSIPVVALTASAIKGDQEKCQAAGMNDYMSKPVNKAVLSSVLSRWIPNAGIGAVSGNRNSSSKSNDISALAHA